MPIIPPTSGEYHEQFLRSLPTGPAWPKDPASTLWQATRPLFGPYEQTSTSAADLLVDAYPPTTTSLLPEWEATVGLPGPCTPEGGTLEERRAAMVARLAAGGGASKAFFESFASAMGYTVQITEYPPFRVGISVAGDPVPDPEAIFYWLVTVAGGQNPAVLECEMRRIAPAHLRLWFRYGGLLHSPAPIQYPIVRVGTPIIGGVYPIVSIGDGVFSLGYPVVSIGDGVFSAGYPIATISNGTFTAGGVTLPLPAWTTAAGGIGSFTVASPITPVQFTATNAATFAVVSGALPAGLTLSTSGLLTGTPTAAAVASFTVRASGSGGTADRTFSAIVEAAPVEELSWLTTQGRNIVDDDANTVWLKGVNWHGGEGASPRIPLQLWSRSYTSIIDQIATLGFNVIRMPLTAATNASTMPSDFNALLNPNFVGLTIFQIIDKIVDYAGSKGIRIFLDLHRLTPGDGTDSAISSSTLPQIKAWWQMIATRFGGNPTICGADLYNEPHTQTWAQLAPMYEELGNAIHAIEPNWLILCEGTGQSAANVPYWWGGQLADVATRQVSLTHANKVVYSPHDYGHSVSSQPWLKSNSNANVNGWPTSLDAVFDAAWGFIAKQNIAPILVGEFGGDLGYTGNGGPSNDSNAGFEREWFSRLCLYMTTNGINSTFWTFTPQSSDTGGILCDDGVSVQTGKMALLQGYLSAQP